MPLSIEPIENNKIYSKYKTSKHELKNVQKTLDNINLNVKDYIDVNLIGDKAYITKEEFNVFGRKVKIITPRKRNQKIKTTLKNKKLLNERYKIENFFAKLKKNTRIKDRKEKTITNYLSFVYIGCLEIYFEFIK